MNSCSGENFNVEAEFGSFTYEMNRVKNRKGKKDYADEYERSKIDSLLSKINDIEPTQIRTSTSLGSGFERSNGQP